MPSNYNTRFFFRFDTDAHREMRINIQQRGYTGTAVQRPLGEGAAVLKRDSGNNGIFGTSLEIIAECNSDDEYAVLYTSDPREFYVELIDVDRNVTLWDGFVSPELYSAPEVYPPYDVRIIAVDGLGELKRDNFVNAGRTSILNHLISILSHSGLQTNASNILVIDSLSCQTPYVPGASLLSSIQVDLGNLTEQEMTCYEALEAILATLNLTITRYGSKWLLIRESDVEVEAGTITAKTAAGDTVVLPVIDYGSAANHDWWPVGRVENEVVPARNRVSVSLAYARRTMLENADLVNGSGWIYPEESIDNPSHYVKWMQIADGLRPELRNVIENGTVTIRQEISVAQFDGRLTLRVLTMQFGGYTKPKYKVFLRVAISDGTNIRFLNYHENGNYCEWVSSSMEIEYEEQVLSGYSSSAQIPISAFNAKEFAIPWIPITGTLGVFITAKRTSFLSDPCDFFLGGVYLSQDAVPGYKDTIVIDNGARGSAGDAVSVFGDAPYTPNGLKNVLNVTADGNGVITTDWQTSKFGGELLSVIAMDRALGVALPRLLSKGVLNVPSNAGLPAIIVNPDGIPMLIQRSSWKLLDDEVEVEILSVPAGSVEITSESIVPISEDQAEAITGGTAGTSGGGGTPSTPVPEEKLFEAIYGNGGITGAKALYDIFIKQVEADEEQQIEEQLKNTTEILKHLFLVPNDGRPYIRSDIGFVSEDFVSGAGLSTTQGGGGGGGSIATLSDVSLSGLANGNILRYDASVGMWRNEALNLGTAASYNIGIVAQGDNGLVTGGAVYDAINTILSSAVKFVGITTTALTDGSTTSTVTIDGASHAAQRGDVVIYGGKEFLWTGSLWQQMGDEASWALKTITITGTGYLTGGGTLEANRTIDIADEYKTMIQHGQTAYETMTGYLPLTGGTLTGGLSINSTLSVIGTSTFGDDIHFTKSGNTAFYADAATGYFRIYTGGDSSNYALYIASTKATYFGGNAIIEGERLYGRGNSFTLYVRDLVSSSSPVDKIALDFSNVTSSGTTLLRLGYDVAKTGATNIYGGGIGFAVYNGTSYVNAANFSTSGYLGINNRTPSYRLDVGGDIRASGRLYIGTGGAYIEVDSDGNLHTASGFYSNSFVSGGGLSSTSGSGGGGVDLAAMWNSLTNSVTDAYANTPIAVAHIPSITTAKISNLDDWITSKGFITAASLPLATDGSRGGIQIGFTTDATNRNYAVQLSSEKAYVNVPWVEYNFVGTTFTSGDKNNGEHDANNIITNGVWYYTSNGPSTSIGASANTGAIISQNYTSIWVAQIAQDYRNGRLFFRGKNSGTWTEWLTNIDSGNYPSVLNSWVESKIAAEIPPALPNPYALTFGSKTYDGSAATTLTAADLGALTSINVTNYDSTLSRNASSMTLARVQGTAITVSVPNFALVSDIPIELPNPKALTFNTSQRSYDGSSAMTLTAADLGALTTVQVVNYDSTLSRNASSMTLARVHGTAITVSVPNFALVSDIPTSLPNPYALSFGSKTYDGSALRTITASDFGLGSAASNIDTLFGYFNGYGAANEAVQLTTTRTIWGQEFDGTQNVSGAISGATTGAFSSWVQASYYYVGSSATAYLEYRNNMLHANVGFYADGPLSGAGLSTTSDVRLKTDITGISFEKARRVIAELRPVTFRWRADGTPAAGFVAQEVAPFLPDAVTEVGGTLRLKYDQIFTYGMAVLSGLLGKTESIERRVQRLEGEVLLLREENNRLRARINA